jgi:hypothetical protein
MRTRGLGVSTERGSTETKLKSVKNETPSPFALRNGQFLRVEAAPDQHLAIAGGSGHATACDRRAGERPQRFNHTGCVGSRPALSGISVSGVGVGVAALQEVRKSELLDRTMLCITRGRLTHYGGSCSSVSRLSGPLRPRVAGLAALTPAARELEGCYGDRSRVCDAVQISAFSDDC